MNVRILIKILLATLFVAIATLVAYTISIKFAADNRETINVASYNYGKIFPISLGAIKNPDAYVHLKLRFRADSTEGYPNVFQTAPVNRGMRMEISESMAAIIVSDSSVLGDLTALILTTTLKAGQWYVLEVEALNGAYVRAKLDGQSVANYASANLDIETSQILVGGGFDASRAFRGQIEDISITKGNYPSSLNNNRVILYLVLLIGALLFFIDSIWRRRASIVRTATNASAATISMTIALLVGAGFLYYIFFYIVTGYLPSPFVWTKSETFMDLFNVLYWAYDDGRYTEWKSVYPPLTFHLLRLLNFVFGGMVTGSASLMREGSPYLIGGFYFIYLLIPAIVLRNNYWKDHGFFVKLSIYFAILLSSPMLFTLERGNIILFCLILLTFVVSRIGFVRALCIGLLINLKPYFVLLLVYYVARRDWKGLGTSVLLSGLIFLLGGLFLDVNFLLFFQSILGFAKDSRAFSSMEAMSLPSSISAFSYVLQHPDAGILKIRFSYPILVAITVFLIGAAKWIGIATCFSAIFTRSRVMSDAEILTLLIVIVTNLGVSVGGYSLIFYAALLPIFLTMKGRWTYIGLVSVIAMPWDIIPLMARHVGEQYSYLSDSYVSVRWTQGLGGLVRPIANFALLICISREVLARQHEASVFFRRFSKIFCRFGRHSLVSLQRMMSTLVWAWYCSVFCSIWAARHSGCDYRADRTT